MGTPGQACWLGGVQLGSATPLQFDSRHPLHLSHASSIARRFDSANPWMPIVCRPVLLRSTMLRPSSIGNVYTEAAIIPSLAMK